MATTRHPPHFLTGIEFWGASIQDHHSRLVQIRIDPSFIDDDLFVNAR
jgi:hypothetical protein